MGAWYNYASTSNYDDVDVACFKKNYYGFTNATTLYFLESFVDDKGTIDNENTTRQIDPSRPGVIRATKTVTVKGVFGQKSEMSVNADSVIVYTDYDNVQLRMSCSNVPDFWSGSQFLYYFVLVRSRNFDSVKKMAPVMQALIKAGITNFDNFVLLNNNSTCIN